jgi:hypothetical protein
MMASSPWFWLTLLIAALVIFGKGYDTGSRHAREHAAAQQLEAVAEAKEQAAEQAETDQQTAENYEVARERVRTVFVKIKEQAHDNINKNPDYDQCGLDADGLRLYNSHPGGAENPASGADSAVPGSTGLAGRQTVNDFEQQLGAVTDVLRLPAAPQGAIGLGAATGEEIAAAQK